MGFLSVFAGGGKTLTFLAFGNFVLDRGDTSSRLTRRVKQFTGIVLIVTKRNPGTRWMDFEFYQNFQDPAMNDIQGRIAG